MIDIIIITNVFEKTKERRSVPVTCGTIYDYVDAPETKRVFLNGEFVTDAATTYPQDGDQLVVVPIVGKGLGSILGWVATIALVVYAPGWGASIAGKLGLAAKAWGTIIGAGIMILGGKLINHFTGAQQQGADDTEKSPSYGWDLPQVQTFEGATMGETYGEAMPAPQLLLCHVETKTYAASYKASTMLWIKKPDTDDTSEADVQYLNLLFCGGIGPVDRITDIRIDYTPIANFTDAQVETRLGHNVQDPISFFPDTILDQSIELELAKGKPITRTTGASNVKKLEVTLSFLNGLYYINDKSGYSSATVKFTIEYRKAGVTDYTKLDLSVTRSKNAAVRLVYEIADLEEAQYDVRVTMTEAPSGSRYVTYMTWSQLSSYVYDGSYVRPCKVLVGMRIKATNQLSGGIPNVNWRQWRDTVYVWNPATSAYEAKSARNPIWAAYDILHGCKYLDTVAGGHEYVVDGSPAKRFDRYYDQWAAAAAYADELVTNNLGEQEKRFEFDAFFDTAGKRYDAALRASGAGHAVIIPHGTQYGIVVDRPGSMVQVFGEGRTLVSSFKGSFASRDERARSVNVTYNDCDNNFKNTIFLVRSKTYAEDISRQDNTASLTLFGVKRRTQAYREAIYLLACNERQLQHVEYDADVNALVCEYGDIVGVSHAVAQLGEASGRIRAVAGNTVTLDKAVTMEAGKAYALVIQRSADDVIVTRRVNAVSETTATPAVTVAEAFDAGLVPEQYDCYAFGIVDKVVKPFRVAKAVQSGDQQVKLSCVEYDPAIYEVDYDRYPVIDYATDQHLAAPISLLLAEQNYSDSLGIPKHVLQVVWSLPAGARADRFLVYISSNGTDWQYWGSTLVLQAAIDSFNPPCEAYVKVCASLSGVNSEFAVAKMAMAGVDTQPPDVTALDCEVMASGLRRYWWTFAYPDPNDIAGFRLKYTQGTSLNWDAGIPVQDGLVTAQPYETQTVRQGMHAVMIKAVDNAGNESANFAYCILDMGDLLKQNVLYTIDYAADGWSGVAHTGYYNANTGYIDPYNESYQWTSTGDFAWKSADSYAWESRMLPYTVQAEFTAPASGQFWLQYDISGPAIVYYRKNGTLAAWGMDKDAAAWPSPDDAAWKNAGDLWKQYSDRVMVQAGDLIQVKIQALNNINEMTVIKGLRAVIDVPDLMEHFEDILVPTAGLTLPITTPHYYTTAVRIDAVQGDDSGIVLLPKIISRNPCVIKLVDSAGNPASATIDVTWQGYQQEVITS